MKRFCTSGTDYGQPPQHPPYGGQPGAYAQQYGAPPPQQGMYGAPQGHVMGGGGGPATNPQVIATILRNCVQDQVRRFSPLRSFFFSCSPHAD